MGTTEEAREPHEKAPGNARKCERTQAVVIMRTLQPEKS